MLLLAGRKCQAGVCWGHWGGVWGGGFLSYILIFTTLAIFAMAKTLKSMRRWLFIFVRLICSDCHHLCNLCNCKKKQGVWVGVTWLPFVRLICSDFHDLCNRLGEGRPLRQPEGEKVLQSWKGATASSSGSSTELCFDWFEIGNYHFLWLQVDWKAYEPVRPSFLGTRVFDNYDLSKLVRLLFTF